MSFGFSRKIYINQIPIFQYSELDYESLRVDMILLQGFHQKRTEPKDHTYAVYLRYSLINSPTDPILKPFNLPDHTVYS
jgi:hypothetical protein